MAMTDQQNSDFKWAVIGLLALPLSGLTYVLGFWVSLEGSGNAIFSLGFPPALLLSCLALAHFHARGCMPPSLQIAVVCAAVAAATFLVMITVQTGLSLTLLEDYRVLEEGVEKTAALWALRSMDQTQLAMDIAWDVWISMATVAFGIAMLNKLNSNVVRLIGLSGVIAGVAGLGVNFFAYPLTPTAVGLPDPGIFFFTWFVLAAVHLVMVVVKRTMGSG
jgi:hypothetical protein